VPVRSLFVLVPLVALGVGCGPEWQIVRQEPPPPPAAPPPAVPPPAVPPPVVEAPPAPSGEAAPVAAAPAPAAEAIDPGFAPAPAEPAPAAPAPVAAAPAPVAAAPAPPPAVRPPTPADFATMLPVRAGDTQADVRARLGAPDLIDIDNDGVTWRFPSGLEVTFVSPPATPGATPSVARARLPVAALATTLTPPQRTLLDSTRADLLSLGAKPLERDRVAFLLEEPGRFTRILVTLDGQRRIATVGLAFSTRAP
jgi:hypothetical protein